MNQEDILNYILNPDRLKEISFDRLKQALTDYPYSQNLHFLLAQKSLQEEHPDFERHLKTAATYMSNRSFLRKQLQGSDRPSQPIVEPEPEAEPAQGNFTPTVAPENPLTNLPDQELPPVTFIPDTPAEEVVPNRVADIVTDTPPADQPPPSETSENPENSDPIPPVVPDISVAGNKTDDPEIAPIEKKIIVTHEPIADQSRIINEPIAKVKHEEPVIPGSNIPDLSTPEMEEISGMDLEEEDLAEEDLEEDTMEIISVPETEMPEIIEFPEQFDFDDEMDDLLSEPLIEVVPENFAKKNKDTDLELEEEEELLGGLEEITIMEELNTEIEEPLTIQPGLEKWMKKYQSAEEEEPEKKKDKKRSKNKSKAAKTKKKGKKKKAVSKAEKKGKKTEKVVKPKADSSQKVKKKKKKTAEEKLSKKKAIRKFASRSIVEDGETISMTLADLYVKQGKIEKAIVAYERLSLIIPEKKAFFASLIKKLKKK